jgi:hypothetical protein
MIKISAHKLTLAASNFRGVGYLEPDQLSHLKLQTASAGH